MSLSFEEYQAITEDQCAYCGGALPVKGYGIDRKDSEQGYTLDNSVACCTDCNATKSSRWSHSEFLEIGKVIKRLKEERRCG